MKHNLILLGLFFLSFYACVDDGDRPPAQEKDDTTYYVTEPSDGSIASGVSGTYPAFMSYSSADHRLKTNVESQIGLYKDNDAISIINLTFSSSDWASQLKNLESTDGELAATLSYNGVALPYKVGVSYKGDASDSSSTKRSFNLSIDYANKDQLLNGYYTVVLNSDPKDPSYLREAVYRKCIQRYIPASQVDYVNLRINGVDYGLYVNTEYLNATFIKEWFLSSKGARWRAEPAVTGEGTTAGLYGTGYSGLNYLGDASSAYEPYYNLKNTPKDSDPYAHIAAVCKVLEKTAPEKMETEIRNVLDLDRTLWFLACENIFTDKDSYVKKGGTDFFLYWEAETGRMAPLEYDGNDTFGEKDIQWDPFYHADNAAYPLLYRLLQVPDIRQRYLAHYRTILEEVYNTGYLYNVIDTYAARIDSAIQADPKKSMTYNEFKTAVSTMKSAISQRSAFLNQHDSIAVKGLTIADVCWKVDGTIWKTPEHTDTVAVTAAISGGSASSVFLCAGTGMVGGFRRLQMYDNGSYGDAVANDGIYTALINPQATGVSVRFYIEVVRGNAARTRTYMPAGAEHDVYSYSVK